jgi:hypothetical protein
MNNVEDNMKYNNNNNYLGRNWKGKKKRLPRDSPWHRQPLLKSFCGVHIDMPCPMQNPGFAA